MNLWVNVYMLVHVCVCASACVCMCVCMPVYACTRKCVCLSSGFPALAFTHNFFHIGYFLLKSFSVVDFGWTESPHLDSVSYWWIDFIKHWGSTLLGSSSVINAQIHYFLFIWGGRGGALWQMSHEALDWSCPPNLCPFQSKCLDMCKFSTLSTETRFILRNHTRHWNGLFTCVRLGWPGF